MWIRKGIWEAMMAGGWPVRIPDCLIKRARKCDEAENELKATWRMNGLARIMQVTDPEGKP